MCIRPPLKRVNNRRDPQRPPLRYIAVASNCVARPIASRTQPTCKIAYRRVTMTVAYEQYSKFCKHGPQKNACPSFREICSTEIRIRKDESSRFIVDCTVQINDPVEIVPER